MLCMVGLSWSSDVPHGSAGCGYSMIKSGG